MRRLWVVLTFILGLSMVGPGAVAADHGYDYDELYCDGQYSGVSVSGNVYVGYGDDCYLENVYVDGNVIVESGAVRMFGSTVSGNVESAHAHRFVVKRNSIYGNVIVHGTVPYYRADRERAALLVRNRISGNVELYDNTAKIRVAKNEIDGNIDAYGNWGAVIVARNYVDGNISAYENYGRVVVTYNRVCGDIEHYSNSGKVKVGYNDHC